MFNNMHKWAIVYYICSYVMAIPFGFLLLFYFRVKKETSKGNVMAALMYLILFAGITIVFIRSSSEFLQVLILSVILGTSPLVGSGIYFLWHGITRKGMDKKESK